MEIALPRPRFSDGTRGRSRELRTHVSGVEPDRLYREHGASLFRYLVHLSGDGDLAADVLQDTFLRLVERPPGRHDHLKAWLFRVATNRLRDLSRKSSRRRSLLSDEVSREALADPPPAPDRMAESAEERSAVRRALDTLSPRDRSILLMREEGFAHREIAEAVGTTTGSVGTLIARALDKLGRALEEAGGVSGSEGGGT